MGKLERYSIQIVFDDGQDVWLFTQAHSEVQAAGSFSAKHRQLAASIYHEVEQQIIYADNQYYVPFTVLGRRDVVWVDDKEIGGNRGLPMANNVPAYLSSLIVKVVCQHYFALASNVRHKFVRQHMEATGQKTCPFCGSELIDPEYEERQILRCPKKHAIYVSPYEFKRLMERCVEEADQVPF